MSDGGVKMLRKCCLVYSLSFGERDHIPFLNTEYRLTPPVGMENYVFVTQAQNVRVCWL